MSSVSESVIDSLLKKKQNDNYKEIESQYQYDDHVDSNLIEKIKKESDEELFSDDVETRQKKAIAKAYNREKEGSTSEDNNKDKEESETDNKAEKEESA